MPGQSYLIIGGCGFLGKHIISLLLERGESEVAVLDLVYRDGLDKRVSFYSGDITDEAKIKEVFAKVRF
jgi:sterol-4alpha-carboxylate 3-dehydrogenase (decarboxylating)